MYYNASQKCEDFLSRGCRVEHEDRDKSNVQTLSSRARSAYRPVLVFLATLMLAVPGYAQGLGGANPRENVVFSSEPLRQLSAPGDAQRRPGRRREAQCRVNCELNVIGSGFPYPWDPWEERKHYDKGTWSPSSETFARAYGPNAFVHDANSFHAFLGLIETYTEGSIKRINVASHGNRGLIAFEGTINTGTVTLTEKTGIDLAKMNTQPRMLERGTTEKESLGAIAHRLRNRFTTGAEIFFYLCNSGVDMELLQEIANAFQVTVKGFREQIWFCPKPGKVLGEPAIVRAIPASTTLGGSCSGAQRGYKHLDRSAVSASPR
jgi:hypothetical protein